MSTRRCNTPAGASAGFTLVELMVVVVILGVFSTVAFPRLAALASGYQLKGAVQSFVSDAQRLRLRSITENSSFRITVAGDGGSYSICEENPGSLGTYDVGCFSRPVDEQSGVVVTGGTGATLTYTRRGFLQPEAGVVVTFSHQNGAALQVVANRNGRVAVQ